ncbi:hemolysin HlyE [Escherichia coli]|nr:hemolysin HlyE [Escherichia coli]EIR2335511.1 hemolysin HlyE [Escherichia coli]MCQ0122918.1 hemolysin HlyE [Escherichia coli]MCQ0459766.1 hemolysin HlyE [Escherichia coli]HAM9615351.1 hemolysin HlyE [Escherichia coli]
MTEIVADKTVEVVKNAIETADGALDLYNKYLDQVIPWQTFDETIKELSRFKQEYSQAASVLVGDIKTLLMDSQDKYFEATQTVYEWCGVATQLLAAYIFLFDEYNEKKASAQKDILIKVLDDGITKLNEAQKSLLVSSQSFNNASGKLLALDSQLPNDFSEKSSYFQSQVDKIRKEAYAGAAAGVVAGPFGLIISYSIAAGVVEGKLIPELKNKLKSVQNFFTTLSNTVKQANKDIDAAKLKLTTEIAAIGEIKTETETTRFYVDYDDLMLSLLKEAAKKMINTCNEYQKRHSLRYLKSDKRLFSPCTQGIRFITFKNTDVF